MSERATPPALPRKRRDWWMAGIVVVALTPLIAVVIGYFGVRISNASAIQKLEAGIKQSGEPLTFADLAAAYPAIPDDENGAVLLLRLWQKESPEFWTAFLDGAGSLPRRPQTQIDAALPFLGEEAKRISRRALSTPANLIAAENCLAEHKSHLEAVRAALHKSRFRFPVVITNGFAVLLPHLAELKKEAQMCRIQALRATELGDVEGAIAAIQGISQAGNALTTEPLLISQLVRIACSAMALEEIERLLSWQSLSGTQLTTLQSLLDQLRMPGALRLSFLSDRVHGVSVFTLPPKSLARQQAPPTGDVDEARARSLRVARGILNAVGFEDADRRFLLETMERAIALAEREDAESLKECEDLLVNANYKANRFPQKVVCAAILQGMEKVPIRFAALEGFRRSALVAVGVEQFRLANAGQRPEKIDDLVPQFLNRVPTDPFDGKPIRYKKLEVGYVVYSVGADRTDDGGKERPPQSSENGYDWVFIVER